MTKEEFDEQSLIDRIESRINAEYRKHKAIDWAKIAAIKIVGEFKNGTIASPLPPAEGEYEGHKQRHVNLHGSLDELFADFIRHNPNMDSYLDITIDRLLKWSYEQTLNPTE